MTLLYTVAATFDDAAVAEEWVAWLRDGHLAEVIAGGATEAEVVRLDAEGPARLEARYRFPSREAFARYEREHAPRLRAEGMARFPAERGVRLARSIGVSALRVPSTT